MIPSRLISLPQGMVPHFHQLENKDRKRWFCSTDPKGLKVGSGGGTASLLTEAWEANKNKLSFTDWIEKNKKLVIHAGGQGRRLPAYSLMGKSLLPVPVFRWSKGQSLEQKLLDFQVSYYEKILDNAPDDYCLFTTSGDVMFISQDRFRNLPKADVLVFGIWVDDETASKHGVFFSRKEKQDELAFVKQKPNIQSLRELSQNYYYLMDSGMVLFSAKALMKLMERSGWDNTKNQFIDNAPSYYDLYGEMLTSFGTEAGGNDKELHELKVKLYPLHEGEFYHFGSNTDLINSNLRLQNRISDQRLKHSRTPEHHPSIFQQNAITEIKFKDENHHIWIENSCISKDWQLRHHHILTGIPKNNWNISLPENICVDIIPVNDGQYCLRIYGFNDAFRGSINQNTQYLEKELKAWFKVRGINPENSKISADEDIFRLPLFPVLEEKELQDMLKFIAGIEVSDHLRKKWIESTRFSAENLANNADMNRLYHQRNEYLSHSVEKLSENHVKSIFYHLDLLKTAKIFQKNNVKLPEELNNTEPLIKRINDNMFRAMVLQDKTSDQYEKRAFQLLREHMIDTLKAEPLKPQRNLLDDQIIWGRSPVRFDFAGGWTDTPPYCIMNGGKVVNMAVELNGQPPLQVFARPLEEYKIILRSIDLGQMIEINSFEELEKYQEVGGGFSIPLAALVLSGFGNEFSTKDYPDLASQLKDFGCGIELSLLAAIPKGSGLGTSSNLAATVLGTLNDFCGLKLDPYKLAYRSLILEQMLTTGGGWQDQYGGMFEGVKMIESIAGIHQDPVVKWLPDQLFTNPESKGKMLLYYTGVTRVAKNILGDIVEAMFLNSHKHLEIFAEMKTHAEDTFNAILSNNFDAFAEKIDISWRLNQALDEGTNPPAIQNILDKIVKHLRSCKLLGAGGGGYLFLLAHSHEDAVKIKTILEKNPPNARARFVEFNISQTGFVVSRS